MYKVFPCQQRKCEMDTTCGYYPPSRGDQRFISSVEEVFDTAQMRARPLHHLSREELTQNVLEIVLENPNHVKEFLHNINKSSLRTEQLMQALQGFDADVLNSLCDRGVVQSDHLDQLRFHFNQSPHTPLVRLAASDRQLSYAFSNAKPPAIQLPPASASSYFNPSGSASSAQTPKKQGIYQGLF